jgi:hypothetical protein
VIMIGAGLFILDEIRRVRQKALPT